MQPKPFYFAGLADWTQKRTKPADKVNNCLLSVTLKGLCHEINIFSRLIIINTIFMC
jgi:hypothetical protein